MPGVKGQVQARGVERRQAIVDAAIEHFGRDGYRGTGIAAIAEQAGVTPGGLLHHFGSKEGLLVQVLQRRDDLTLETFQDMGTGTAREDFALWIEIASWNEERAELAALYTILHAEAIDPAHPAHDYFVTRTRTVLALVEDTLQRGIDQGELRPDLDVAAKAAEMVAFTDGAIANWLQTRRPGALRTLFEHYFADQLTLLTPPAPASRGSRRPRR
jgi:AcrR family transcriptional regulator